MSPIRRGIDICVGIAGLAVMGPAIVCMAAIARLELKKPAFFRQVRYGLHGKPFEIIKIRTLDERMQPLPISGSLRRIGLDEVPQLINLIRGDMSIIGPRPHERLLKPVAGWDHMLNVAPGLTGMASVVLKERGAHATSAEKAEIDGRYVAQRLSGASCLGTDLDILCRSARLVLRARADLGKILPANVT